jgi:hypothetical protein
VASLTPAPSHGQTPTPQPPAPQRPSNAVFRGAGSGHDTLALNTSLYGGYDDEATPTGDEASLSRGGGYSGLDFDLTFTPSSRGRASFDLRGMSSVRYYARQQDIAPASQSFSAGSTVRLTRRLGIQARGGVAYTPSFDFAALPGMEESTSGPEVPERIRDTGVTLRRILTYDAGADLTHSLTERTSLVVRYAARQTRLLDESQSSIDTTVSGQLSRRFNRRFAGRISYVHRDGEYLIGDAHTPVRVDELEFSADRNWARSPTRRTTLGVAFGPSIVEQENNRFVRAFGGVTFTHPFGRSWDIRTQYRRGVTFLEGTSAPFLSHSGSFGMSGLLTRRLDTSFSIGAVLGEIGLDGATVAAPTAYDTYSASMRFRYAMNDSFALYGEYMRNYSQYSSSSPLPGLDRTGFRIGGTFYWPLVQERAARRPR